MFPYRSEKAEIFSQALQKAPRPDPKPGEAPLTQRRKPPETPSTFLPSAPYSAGDYPKEKPGFHFWNPGQTVNKVRNRQNRKTILTVFTFSASISFYRKIQINCVQKQGNIYCFDLLRNSRLTVPMYAYRREIPCLSNFLDRLSACQKGFLTRCDP